MSISKAELLAILLGDTKTCKSSLQLKARFLAEHPSCTWVSVIDTVDAVDAVDTYRAIFAETPLFYYLYTLVRMVHLNGLPATVLISFVSDLPDAITGALSSSDVMDYVCWLMSYSTALQVFLSKPNVMAKVLAPPLLNAGIVAHIAGEPETGAAALAVILDASPPGTVDAIRVETTVDDALTLIEPLIALAARRNSMSLLEVLCARGADALPAQWVPSSLAKRSDVVDFLRVREAKCEAK